MTRSNTLPPGPHQYEIQYVTTRQISPTGNTDVLHWNVNGQGWVIPSDIVSATVHIPGAARVIDYTAWTGPEGSQNTDFQSVENGDGSITFTSTRAFRPYEGMTIMLGLPAGTVAKQGSQFVRFIKENFMWLSGLLLLLLLPVYYIKAWRDGGARSAKGCGGRRLSSGSESIACRTSICYAETSR